MTDFNNPIEKYNEQDKKIFGFLRKIGNLIDYISYGFFGVFLGWIGWLAFFKQADVLSMVLCMAVGAILCITYVKIEVMFEEKYQTELPIVPILLFLNLIILGILYLYI